MKMKAKKPVKKRENKSTYRLTQSWVRRIDRVAPKMLKGKTRGVLRIQWMCEVLEEAQRKAKARGRR